MSKKLISETYLSATADAIRGKTGDSGTLTPAQFASAIGSISTGGGSSWEHIAHAEYDVSTTSTTATNIGQISLPLSVWTESKILYVRTRDKAGAREGYLVGNDCFLANYSAANSSSSCSVHACLCTRHTASGTFTTVAYAASGAYGIFPLNFTKSATACTLTMRRRYNSTSTLTIDGTYTVDVFMLDYPDGYPSAFYE